MEKVLNQIEIELEKQEYNPSIKKEVEEFLLEELKKLKPKNILEIGTNLGRSSLLFLKASPFSLITTIEKDENTFFKAKDNFAQANVSKKITQILGDAKEVLISLKENSFDFIFLDGPKGQYIHYLPHLKKLLKKGGVLVADNVFFKGEVLKDALPARKHRTIILNLRQFLSTLENDKDFSTKLFNLGDGISVSVKLS